MTAWSLRCNEPERMDDPACDARLLDRTLDQFVVMNRLVSRYRSILTRYVLRDMARAPKRVYRLLDLGAGGGDIARWLCEEATRRGWQLTVVAIDSDPRAIAYARARAGSAPGLEIHRADLMDMAAFGPVDYIFSNHVLHHLPDALLPRVMRLMDETATRCWLASDLLRSRISYTAFCLLAPFFRDSFTFEDGRRSIRRGFRVPELLAHARAAAPRATVRVERLFPGRLLLAGLHANTGERALGNAQVPC